MTGKYLEHIWQCFGHLARSLCASGSPECFMVHESQVQGNKASVLPPFKTPLEL